MLRRNFIKFLLTSGVFASGLTTSNIAFGGSSSGGSSSSSSGGSSSSSSGGSSSSSSGGSSSSSSGTDDIGGSSNGTDFSTTGGSSNGTDFSVSGSSSLDGTVQNQLIIDADSSLDSVEYTTVSPENLFDILDRF
jgi:hypothetical protein